MNKTNNTANGLPRMVDWARTLATEALTPGDIAVDLTVGNGNDTLWLARAVLPGGLVIGFDIQRLALLNAQALLGRNNIEATVLREPAPAKMPGAGAVLVNDDHANLNRYISAPVKVAIANLGYLPGADKKLVTTKASTISALTGAMGLLAPGGRLIVVCYTGHPGGREEADAVAKLFRSLESSLWSTLELGTPNALASPLVLAAEALTTKN